MKIFKRLRFYLSPIVPQFIKERAQQKLEKKLREEAEYKKLDESDRMYRDVTKQHYSYRRSMHLWQLFDVCFMSPFGIVLGVSDILWGIHDVIQGHWFGAINTGLGVWLVCMWVPNIIRWSWTGKTKTDDIMEDIDKSFEKFRDGYWDLKKTMMDIEIEAKRNKYKKEDTHAG